MLRFSCNKSPQYVGKLNASLELRCLSVSHLAGGHQRVVSGLN